MPGALSVSWVQPPTVADAGVASLAAWAQNSSPKEAAEGTRGYPPGTVFPGVSQTLKALMPSGHFHPLGNSLWTRVFEDFGGCGGDPEKPVFSNGMHSTEIYPVGVMCREQTVGGEGWGKAEQVTKEPAM